MRGEFEAASRPDLVASTDRRGAIGSPPVLPRSVILPVPQPLPPGATDRMGRPALWIEHSPRRIAFQSALTDFLQVLVEGEAAPEWLPTFSERAHDHFEGMFRVTLHGLLLAADPSACAVFLLDNARSVASILPRLVADREGKHVDEVLRESRVYGLARSYASEIWHWAGEVAAEVARESVDAEVRVFPHLLTALRDNILMYTHLGMPSPSELGGYIESLWGVDGANLVTEMSEAEQELCAQWEGVPEWMRTEIGVEPGAAGSVESRWPGLLTKFACSGQKGAPDKRQAQVWEFLQLRLRQYSLLSETAERIVPVERRDHGWRVVGAGDAEPGALLSPDIRPLPLFSTQGTGSTVQRFGLRYDVSNFSSIMASLELMPAVEREAALRRFFFFQRRVQNAARQHGLRLEKYFGDGILFSAPQSAREVLAAAVEIQRAYRQAVDRGMVFAGGIRLAANWGAYRVVAQVGDFDAEATSASEGQLFGPGIVEISRLVGGKVSRDLNEIKKLLNGAGYTREEVDRFFARFEQRHVQVVDDVRESRRFWAYVNPNGTLVNEGIVVTASFLARLLAGVEGAAGRYRETDREFLLLNLARPYSDPLLVGVTHRGFAEFKGLAPIEVFEVVDAREWGDNVQVSGEPDASVNLADFAWLPEPVRD